MLPVTCARGVGLGRKGKEGKGREGKGKERNSGREEGSNRGHVVREAALRRAVRRLNHELDSD